jgi:protein-S-isoprenylcysteine O-methyltransferase Ste14
MGKTLRSATALLIGIVIFSGLPLIGWGIKDAEGFISHPARLLYVVISCLLQVLVVVFIPGAGLSRGDGKMVVQRRRFVLLLLQVIPLVIVISAPYSDRHGFGVLRQAEAVRYLGLGLFSVGCAAMHWAVACLDKQFSVQVTIQEDHRLVTDGPYRYLRHPRYAGVIMVFLGISLVFRSWLALPLVGTLALVLIWRIQDEEALLRREIGSDWEAYSKTTWRLIPFVF